MNIVLRTTLMLAVATGSLVAQWRQAPGPEGGYIRFLASVPSGLVASVDADRTYRYDAAAGEWTAIGRLAPYTMHAAGASLVATTDSGIVVSEDAGTSWRVVGPAGGFVVETEGEYAYAVDHERLHRSTDGGVTWSRFADLGPNVQTIATAGPVVLAGVDQEPGVVRSTDGGASWRIASEGLPAFSWPVRMKRHGDRIFASIRSNRPHRNHGMYVSADSGATWAPVNSGLPETSSQFPWVGALLETDGQLFAMTSAGVYALGIDSWTRMTPHPPMSMTVGAHGVFLGTISGVQRFIPLNGVWLPITRGMNALGLNDVEVDDETILTASTAGIHRSTDGGESWSLAHWIPTAQLLLAEGALVARVAAYDSVSLYRSTDGGRRWSSASHDIVDPRAAMVAAAVSGPSLYVGFNEIAGGAGGTTIWRAGGIYRSTDGGAHWSAASVGLPEQNGVPAPIAHLAATGDVAVAATAAGVYRSTDRGTSWQQGGFDPMNGLVTALGVHEGSILLAAGSRVYRSLDAGASWQSTSAGLPDVAITAFHSVDGILYGYSRFAEPNRLFRYAAERWLEITASLPAGVRATAIASNASSILLGTTDAGLWIGSFGTSGIDPTPRSPIESTAIYPNPVRDGARLQLRLDAPAEVTIEITDATGAVVARDSHGTLAPGEQSVPLTVDGLARGSYRYRVVAGRVAATGSFVIQ